MLSANNGKTRIEKKFFSGKYDSICLLVRKIISHRIVAHSSVGFSEDKGIGTAWVGAAVNNARVENKDIT